ncbi:MAG: hypothetical protein O2820_19050 [Planctomycetota bacterium]|nr:hypothetical protein [Planctomycetota bacterium]MDA1251312.1 hypothetical protein [Planctomycetota bacterium]
MAESSDKLLREAVSLLREIRDRLDRAEDMRESMLDELGDQFDSASAMLTDDLPDSDYDEQLAEMQEAARLAEEETRDFREVVTLELRAQSAILTRIADALGAQRKDISE